MNIIDYHKDSLPLLSPAALRYYLPAWLIRALDDPSGDLMEFTIFHLTPSRKSIESSAGYFEARFSPFDASQRQAVLAFFTDVDDYQLWIGYEGELDRAKKLWGVEA